jgi:hypothetical protein
MRWTLDGNAKENEMSFDKLLECENERAFLYLKLQDSMISN